MTHYNTLGVSESATPEEIKRAYRKLASQHHPDKGGDTAKFQEIEAAYRILSDPAQREQYDHERRNPGGMRFNFNRHDIHEHGMPPGMEEMLRNFGFNFGGHDPFEAMRQRHQHPRRNKDLQVRVPIKLSSIANDQILTISVQMTKGTRENVEINIPRGATNGTQIKYPGLGDNFFDTLPRGDLYVQVYMEPHPNFEIMDLDIGTFHTIDCFTAITGGDIEVTNYDGSTLVLTVPPGTQPGQMLRAKNQGIWVIHGSTKGNLIVKIQVTIPKTLTTEQLELVNKIKSTL